MGLATKAEVQELSEQMSERMWKLELAMQDYAKANILRHEQAFTHNKAKREAGGNARAKKRS